MKKNIFQLLIISVFLGVTAISCESKQENNKQEEQKEAIFVMLDSLQGIYAPDKRVDLWMFKFDEEGETPLLKGMVYEQKAFDDVNVNLSLKFPNLKIELELLPAEGKDQLVNAVVTVSVATIRGNSRHSGEIVTQALMGTPIKILTKKGPWFLVQLPNRYIGWAYKYEVTEYSEKELLAFKANDKIFFTLQNGYSYSEANESSRVVSDLVAGCLISTIKIEKGFYKVEYPDKRIAYVKKTEAISLEEWLKREPVKEKLVKTSEKFMGLPYLWGGTSAKAIDCSGFSSSIYFMYAVLLQRDASQQTKYGKIVDTKTDFSKLEIGDLLFFGRKANDSLKERVSHVGMYIGDSQFIHASGKVRISSVDSTRSDYDEDYVKALVRVTRIINQVDNKGIERIENNKFYKEIFN